MITEDEVAIPVEVITTPVTESSTKKSSTKKSSTKKSTTKIKWKISIEEAVEYGSSVIKAVSPYILVIIVMVASTFKFLSLSFEASLQGEKTLSDIYLGVSFLLIFGSSLLSLALAIGLGYKFGGDVLLKAVETHHRFGFMMSKKKK